MWRDIQSVYEPYIRVVPGNYSSRSEYANWACKAGHWQVAKEQFEIMGSNAVPRKVGGPEELKRLREKAERMATTSDAP